MNKNEFLNSGLVEQYVLGLTDEEETLLVEQYMQRHPDIKLQIKAMQSGLIQYAQAYTRDVLQGGDPTNATKVPVFGKSSSTLSGPFKVVTVLAIALLFIWGLSYLRNSEQGGRLIASALPPLLSSHTGGDSTAVYRNGAVLETKLHAGDLLEHPATLPVVLKGTARYPTCQGIIYYNDLTRQCFLQLQKFPAAPEFKQLQVWADVNGSFHHAGFIKNQLNHFQELKFIDRAIAFNISLPAEEALGIPELNEIFASGRLVR